MFPLTKEKGGFAGGKGFEPDVKLKEKLEQTSIIPTK